MGLLILDREVLFRLVIVVIASLTAIFGTVYSLIHGIFAVFSFLYVLPIICVVYFYPKKAVLFTLLISILYIGLVYVLGSFDPVLIAVSTAWFAIFLTLSVVASSYANGVLEEKARFRQIIENTSEGIFCLEPGSWQILRVNHTCARWLLYSQDELRKMPVTTIWTDTAAHHCFLGEITSGKTGIAFDALFRQKNGGVIRVILSPLCVTQEIVVCSVVYNTDMRVADEEIRQTLEDLERQVRERTAHLERINEELRNEIIERRKIEQTLLSGDSKTASDKAHEEMP